MRSIAILLLALSPLALLANAADTTPHKATAAVQDDAQKQDGAKKAAKSDNEGWKGEPYLLEKCALSGNPLDMKGTRTVKVIEGREYKFCCGPCARAFEADKAKWAESYARVDKAIASRQRAFYPGKTCVVSGEPLFDDEGKSIATEVVIKNRLFRVCCGMCEKAVQKDPAKYAKLLDKEAAKAQAASYPVEGCAVTGGKLGDSPKEFVVAGRLVKTCCGRCAAKVKEDPAKYIKVVDAAWAKARGSDDDGAKPAAAKEGKDDSKKG